MSGLINNNLPLESFPDDVFLVSYPKSGRTWLRFLIGNYLSNNQLDFPNSYQDLVTDIDYNPQQVSQVPRPRFITSHWPFTSDFRRVVYVVRDGRDVAVSYYFHVMKFKTISRETTFEDFVLNIFDTSLYGNVSWSDHVNYWLDKAPQDFLLVKYEAMHENPVGELIKILEFAGLTVDKNTAIAAVEAAKFENLIKFEKSLEQIQHEIVSSSDLSIKFFREGKVGDYKKFFTTQLMEHFLEVHGSALERLGYLT